LLNKYNPNSLTFTHKWLLAYAFNVILIGVAFAQGGLIKSDWQPEDLQEDKPPVSSWELETYDQRVRDLELQQQAEEKSIEQEKANIAAKRAELIECMNLKGVILFSIDKDCEACKIQKEYFGDDFEKIEYVDCKANRFTCPFRGIKSYPTWYLGRQLGIMKEGVRKLPTLARMTGCPW